MRIIEQLAYKITGDTTSFDKSISTSEKNVSKFSKIGITALSALSVGAIAGVTKKMFDLAEQSASTLDTIDKMSQKIGVSREAYQEWDFILSQSGASVDGLQTSIKTLSNASAEARDGTAEYADEFDRLGITVTDANGNLKDSETLFNEVFSALSDMTDETQRTATASKLLGKSATELAPAMNAGSESIEDMRTQAHDLGLVLGDEAVDAGVALTDSLDQLRRSFGNLKTKALLPVIDTMNTVIQKFLGQETAGDKLESSYEDLKTATKNYNDVLKDTEGKSDAVTSALIAQAKATRDNALYQLASEYEDANAVQVKYQKTIDKNNKLIADSEKIYSMYTDELGASMEELAKLNNDQLITQMGLDLGWSNDKIQTFNVALNTYRDRLENVSEAQKNKAKANITEQQFLDNLTASYLNQDESAELLLTAYPELRRQVENNAKAYKKQLEVTEEENELDEKRYKAKGLVSEATEEETKTTEENTEAVEDNTEAVEENSSTAIEAINERFKTEADLYKELKSYYQTDKEKFISSIQEKADSFLKAGIDRVEVAQWVSDQLDSFNQKELEGVEKLEFAWDELANSGITSLVQGFSDIGEALAEGELSWKTMAKISLSALSDVLNGIGTQLLALGAVDLFNPLKAFGAPYFAGASGAFLASGALSSLSASYAVGTISVPKDMPAQVHKDEMILTKGISQEAREQGITIEPKNSKASSTLNLMVYLDSKVIAQKTVEKINLGQAGTINLRVVK